MNDPYETRNPFWRRGGRSHRRGPAWWLWAQFAAGVAVGPPALVVLGFVGRHHQDNVMGFAAAMVGTYLVLVAYLCYCLWRLLRTWSS